MGKEVDILLFQYKQIVYYHVVQLQSNLVNRSDIYKYAES